MIIDPLPSARMLEVIALRAPVAALLPPEWPTAPGAVWHRMDGHPVILHYAPARWFVTTADANAEHFVQATISMRSFEAVDVTGKWLALRLSGTDVNRAMASSADTAPMLDGRGCASTTLFDCPVIVAKGTSDYYLWVQRSYGTDLLAALLQQNRSAS